MDQKHTTAALHTLWQAAGGFAAAQLIITEFANGDSHDAKVGLAAAGTAVIGAGLSLAKGAVVHWLGTRKASALAKDAVETAKVAEAVAAYMAAHRAVSA